MKAMLSDLSLLLMRVSFGLMMMIGHGLPKLNMALAGGDIQFLDPIGLGVRFSLYAAIFAEFFCSILVIIGFQTRIAAGFLTFTMLVAALIVHTNDPFFMKQEFPLMYATFFIGLMGMGAGRYSIDGFLKR